MRQLIFKLSRSAFLRRLVQVLRLHKVGNWWLRHFPLMRKMPGSGIIYRATRLESIPLAVEMFEKGNLYDAEMLPQNFTTFADLGCNVGYFTCWLAHLANGRKLEGVMLDANPEAVEEAKWHVQANGWDKVFGVHGIVGESGKGGAVDFFLYESNICSTSQLPDVEAMGLKGKWTRISVPCLTLEDEWRKRFGNTRCHVLKVDIEGSEMNFLATEQSFLKRVDSILLEWHKWRVSLDEVKACLGMQGFSLVKVLEENEQMGTAIFHLASRI